MVRRKFALITLLAGCFVAQPLIAQAGCGCSKPPPELAEVRPNATYAGMNATLFHANLQSGQTYAVTFASGITGDSATVTSTAVFKRDLADGQEKSQVVVPVPALPLGPTSISVSLAGQSEVVMTATDDAFTVAPQPIVFPETVGEVSLPDYQAAVSRSGVVYISLDVSDMHLPRTFKAQALGYPLRFTNDEVVFYNTQGFMMQLLDEGMPGLFAVDTTTGSSDSDTLQYSRHEFNTHFLQHEERQTHAVDASDPNWHLDGTPHIDHDYLIVAISGMLDDGSLPGAGATPTFELAVQTSTFFQHGLVGQSLVDMSSTSIVDSYQDGVHGSEGNVLSNGEIRLSQSALIDGDATAFVINLYQSSAVTGQMTTVTQPVEFLPVDVPTNLEDLGSVIVGGPVKNVTLSAGSYRAADVIVSNNSTLHIDNAAGPVTLYVSGLVDVGNLAQITVADPDPEKFALYVAGSGPVSFRQQGIFHGVLYAPDASLFMTSQGQFFGSFVSNQAVLSNSAQVHYDPALRGE